MTDFSNYSEDAITNWALGKASMPATGNRYLALYTGVTDAEAGTGTEVTGGGYARVNVTALVGTSSGGAITNTADVEYPQATTGGYSGGAAITHACIRDAATGGNAITAIKALSASVVIAEGDIFRIPVGDLDFATQ